MIPWETLGRAMTPGGSVMSLMRRGTELTIRIDGIDLMSSRQHSSEEELAELGCARLRKPGKNCVLVGGLGLGYTLRAVLNRVPASTTVVVAEIIPEVVQWNRGPLAHLARRPLEDKRVVLDVRDVQVVIAEADQRFDAILLDVDNGPDALVLPGNGSLYSAGGLNRIKRALRPDGRFALWSVFEGRGFVERLRAAGWTAERKHLPARGAGMPGSRHTIFIADPAVAAPPTGRPGARSRKRLP